MQFHIQTTLLVIAAVLHSSWSVPIDSSPAKQDYSFTRRDYSLVRREPSLVEQDDDLSFRRVKILNSTNDEGSRLWTRGGGGGRGAKNTKQGAWVRKKFKTQRTKAKTKAEEKRPEPEEDPATTGTDMPDNIQAGDEFHIAAHSFKVVKELGEGGYGKVFLVWKGMVGEPTFRELVAFKIGSSSAILNGAAEQITFAAKTPYIVEVKGRFQVRRKRILLTEYMPGGDLDDWMQAHPLAEETDLYARSARIRHIMLQLSSAVGVMHADGMTHGDIKPLNALMDKDSHGYDLAKLNDFDLTTRQSLTSSMSGTRTYLPPGESPELPPGAWKNEEIHED